MSQSFYQVAAFLLLRGGKMNNIYVFDIENFTEQDAVNAKKLDKSDKVIFMPNQSGLISYSLFPVINSWKTAPCFMKPIPGDKNEQALLFLLAVQCANTNGDLFIVMENNPFYALDNSTFETEKGEIKIHIYESFEQIMSVKSKRKSSDKKIDSQKVATKNIDEDNIKCNNKDDSIYMGLENDDYYPEASEAFVNLLEQLKTTTTLDLMSVKNAVYDCVKNSDEDVLGGFDLQIELRFKKDYVKEIHSVLEPVLKTLKEAII